MGDGESNDIELSPITRYDAVPVTEQGLDMIQDIKQVAEALAQLTQQACGQPSRELSLGLTQLEITVHCLSRAIALANRQKDEAPQPE